MCTNIVLQVTFLRPSNQMYYKFTGTTPAPVAQVTQTPLLGRNGTGIRLNVNDPVYPDDSKSLLLDLFNSQF